MLRNLDLYIYRAKISPLSLFRNFVFYIYRKGISPLIWNSKIYIIYFFFATKDSLKDCCDFTSQTDTPSNTIA